MNVYCVLMGCDVAQFCRDKQHVSEERIASIFKVSFYRTTRRHKVDHNKRDISNFMSSKVHYRVHKNTPFVPTPAS
jgi:hypothetical protein